MWNEDALQMLTLLIIPSHQSGPPLGLHQAPIMNRGANSSCECESSHSDFDFTSTERLQTEKSCQYNPAALLESNEALRLMIHWL